MLGVLFVGEYDSRRGRRRQHHTRSSIRRFWTGITVKQGCQLAQSAYHNDVGRGSEWYIHRRRRYLLPPCRLFTAEYFGFQLNRVRPAASPHSFIFREPLFDFTYYLHTCIYILRYSIERVCCSFKFQMANLMVFFFCSFFLKALLCDRNDVRGGIIHAEY